jgi:hypothetical protein
MFVLAPGCRVNISPVIDALSSPTGESGLLRPDIGFWRLQFQPFMRSLLVVLPAPVLKNYGGFG